MELGHVLAGGRTVNEAKVVGPGSRRECCREVLLGPINPIKQACLLSAGQFLKMGDRAAGDYEAMAR